MSNKLFSGPMLMLVIFICSQATFSRNTFLALASGPSYLGIFVGPPRVLADNSVYDAIFVQLQYSNGVPARARQDTIIYLSSSLINVGSVDPVITVPAGFTYAVARFNSTYTPGSTTITASASGYMTVQASITTVGPVPSRLAVYSFPPVIPADGGSYPATIVQLQDLNGLPAKAPIEDVNATLSSSNITVGTVDPFVIISAGSTYAVATFHTTNAPGSAVMTAIASGYSSGQATITTQGIGDQPTSLKVYVGPPRVPADGVIYEQVAVQLQDSSGKIAQAPRNIAVALSSSIAAVGTVEPAITINDAQVYALAKFYSTYKSGATIITAVATNYRSSQESLTTVGPIPSKLALYCVPSSLPADDRSYDALLVQLQDSEGTPARDPSGNISVSLFSSTLKAGDVSSTAIIPFGKTHLAASFFSTYTAGSTIITAQTPGYDTGEAAVTTYLIDQYTLNVSITAQPATINSSGQPNLRIHVTYDGLSPVLDATIQLISDNRGYFWPPTDEGNGYYTSVFMAPTVTERTVCTILVSASKEGYISGQANVQVTVNPIILNALVTANPTAINSGEPTTISVYVTYDDQTPAPGATIGLTSDKGGNFSLTTDEGNGYYTSVFTAPTVTTQTVCKILANASKLACTTGQGSAYVTVNSTIHTGSIHLHVKEDSGNPISEANITSISQPTGISSLTGITDEAGYIAFTSVLEGSYTIQITKSGYDTKNETITVTANQTTDRTINLSKTPSLLPSTPVLITIIAIVIFAIVLVAMLIRKYRISLSTSQDSNPEVDHNTTQ